MLTGACATHRAAGTPPLSEAALHQCDECSHAHNAARLWWLAGGADPRERFLIRLSFLVIQNLHLSYFWWPQAMQALFLYGGPTWFPHASVGANGRL